MHKESILPNLLGGPGSWRHQWVEEGCDGGEEPRVIGWWNSEGRGGDW